MQQRRSALWEFLRDFARALSGEARRLVFWSSAIEVIDDHENRLVLSANNRRIVADRRARTVTSGKRLVAGFESIQSIEISHSRNGDGPEFWTVNLATVARKRVRIGRTLDDSQASVAAARLGTITGKKVVAVKS